MAAIPALARWSRELEQLPPFPRSAVELMRTLDDDRASTRLLADLLGRDPALASNVLRMANSAMFRGSARIDTVMAATQRIGVERVAALLSGRWLTRALPARLPFYDLATADHLATALAAAALAEQLALVLRQPTRLVFIAGLLRDLGMLVIATAAPPAAAIAARLAAGESLLAIERAQLGIDHAELGHELAWRWKLPPEIAAASRWHHEPDRTPLAPTLVDLVHVGDLGAADPAPLTTTRIGPGPCARLGLDDALLVRAQAAASAAAAGHQQALRAA